MGHHDADGIPDVQLLAQISAGSLEAGDALYRRYGDRLLGYAFRLTNRNQHAAEDVVQQAFCNLFDALSRGPLVLRGIDLKNYLFQIIRNLSYNLHRKSVRERVWVSENAAVDKGSSELDAAKLRESQEDIDRAAAALSRLSKDQQRILVLRIYDGKSYKEIAVILGIRSEDAAGMRFARALQRLTSICAHIPDLGDNHEQV